jgi:hypothetical protein
MTDIKTTEASTGAAADTISAAVEEVLGAGFQHLDYSGTSPKKVKRTSGRGRGMARESLQLIERMSRIAADIQPVTGRGVGYKLFVAKLISSMADKDMKRVYRLLKEARERGWIPWEWIVDETRDLERTATWDDPDNFSRQMAQCYRRDFWNQQPHRVQVVSEKGTVRGLLKPVLDYYAVGFRVMHGFTSATCAYDLARDDDPRPLFLLYVGDYDPSGHCMSEVDLPKRSRNYGGDHVTIKRLALTREQVTNLPSFPATDKIKDTRFRWFVSNYGDRCWELDAMDPNELRACVEAGIKELIEPVAWARCEAVNKAEQQSLKTVLEAWSNPKDEPRRKPVIRPTKPVPIKSDTKKKSARKRRGHQWFAEMQARRSREGER